MPSTKSKPPDGPNPTPCAVACARSTGKGLGTGAGRPALSSSPPSPIPKIHAAGGRGGRGGASLSTPAPIPKLPTPFGSDGQLFRRGQRAGTERRCWRCECISIETTESLSSLVFAASPLSGGGGVRERKGRQTGPAGAWILGLLPARNKCQSLFSVALSGLGRS